AWIIARHAFDHATPFFAPIAAVVCLGTSYGQQLRRVAEVMAGVAIGVGIGDLFVYQFGSGEWQVAVVVAIAMSAAIVLDAGSLLVSQAAVQAIVVITLLPGGDGGLARVGDALVGGGVALLAATLVPGAPLRRPREAAAEATMELARLLRSARQNAFDVDVDEASATLDRARETEALLADLREAAAEGLDVVHASPFRRRSEPHVRSIAEVVAPLDRALRNTRVLIRRVTVSARLDETMPPDYLALLDQLADVAEAIAAEFAADRAPDAAQPRLVEVAERTAAASEPLTLSAAVVLGQMRSLAIDLLQLSGMSHHEAVSFLPARP
ncbi:MAG: FUSC family protein, partial [Nocardioidaceae bacterium]|nr:FUSC family protein [Nocardioidaceae bacterium]